MPRVVIAGGRERPRAVVIVCRRSCHLVRVLGGGRCRRHSRMVLAHRNRLQRAQRCGHLRAGVLPEACPPIAEPHLDAGLGQVRVGGQLLAGVHVRILGPLEGLLQRFELLAGEGGPRAALFPLQLDPRLGFDVTRVGTATYIKPKMREKKIMRKRRLVTRGKLPSVL